MPRPHRLAVVWLALGLACASGSAPRGDLGSQRVPGQFARLEVALAPGVEDLDAGSAARVVALVRQSARDWLEQNDRLAPDGELALEVTVESAHLRSDWVTWLFAWAAQPDFLTARVSVRQGGQLDEIGSVGVESALSGYAWRDEDARRDRLARRLGHRIAEGL